MDDSQRRNDADVLRAELHRITARTDIPIVFGGEVHDEILLLTEFYGTRTTSMKGLAVRPNAGLGGAAMVAGRPLSVVDYRRSSRITHDYDGPIAEEGIRSIAAVPVLVAGRPRAVLYGARRTAEPVSDCTIELMSACARRLSHELAIRDEVDRRLRLHEAQLANHSSDIAGLHELRAVYAELRQLAADPAISQPVRDRLGELAHQLAPPAPIEHGPQHAALTPRELDVLSQIALGCSNGAAAKRLSLRSETVKSYLRSAAAKLDARGRHDTITKARRSRLIP